jgi:MAD (mothers against decapentaplegic) interacting protein
VVFNGALKSNLTISGRQSTTEDGLMIQIDTEMMGKFKQALRSMKPFRIECSPLAPNDDFVITVEWTKANEFLNRGIRSLVDGRSMQGVKSLRLTNNYDFVNGSKSIRWNEIFLIKG